MNYLRQNGCGFQKRLLSQESFGYSFELLATLPFGIETAFEGTGTSGSGLAKWPGKPVRD